MMEGPIFGITLGTISITICSLRMQVMVHGSFTVEMSIFMKKTLISIFMRPAVKIPEPTERLLYPTVRIYETAFPQIEWPIGDNLNLEGFDITIIQRECEDALEYLDEFDKTHSLGEQDDTYRIKWDIGPIPNSV